MAFKFKTAGSATESTPVALAKGIGKLAISPLLFFATLGMAAVAATTFCVNKIAAFSLGKTPFGKTIWGEKGWAAGLHKTALSACLKLGEWTLDPFIDSTQSVLNRVQNSAQEKGAVTSAARRELSDEAKTKTNSSYTVEGDVKERSRAHLSENYVGLDNADLSKQGKDGSFKPFQGPNSQETPTENLSDTSSVNSNPSNSTEIRGAENLQNGENVKGAENSGGGGGGSGNGTSAQEAADQRAKDKKARGSGRGK